MNRKSFKCFFNFLGMSRMSSMSKVISEKKKERMWRLYKRGMEISKIARKERVSYRIAYAYTRLRERGFESVHDYKDYLARKKGFRSHHYYQKSLAKKRQRNEENRAISSFIAYGLGKKRKSYSWLSRKAGVSKQMISLYARGQFIPSESILRKICLAFRVKPRTLDELLDNGW